MSEANYDIQVKNEDYFCRNAETWSIVKEGLYVLIQGGAKSVEFFETSAIAYSRAREKYTAGTYIVRKCARYDGEIIAAGCTFSNF